MSRIVAGKSDPLIAGQRLFSGRSAVAPVDLILLKDCLWYDAQSLNLIQQQIDVLMTGHAPATARDVDPPGRDCATSPATPAATKR